MPVSVVRGNRGGEKREKNGDWGKGLGDWDGETGVVEEFGKWWTGELGNWGIGELRLESEV